MPLTSSPGLGELRWWPSLAMVLIPYLHFWKVLMNSSSLGGSAFFLRASRTAVGKNHSTQIRSTCMHVSDFTCIAGRDQWYRTTRTKWVIFLVTLIVLPACFFLRDFCPLSLSSSFQAVVVPRILCMKPSMSSITWLMMSYQHKTCSTWLNSNTLTECMMFAQLDVLVVHWKNLKAWTSCPLVLIADN